jgi:deoxycytidylate deaminase
MAGTRNVADTATVEQQIDRFVALVFGSNTISPTKMEYGLYSAKGASMRSLDLSRQVGVAIFSNSGEIISLGSNEVPKGGGGTYWSDAGFDDRDYKRGVDSNYKRKLELPQELKEVFNAEEVNHAAMGDGLGKSQFMDALEYSGFSQQPFHRRETGWLSAALAAIKYCSPFETRRLSSPLLARTFPSPPRPLPPRLRHRIEQRLASVGDIGRLVLRAIVRQEPAQVRQFRVVVLGPQPGDAEDALAAARLADQRQGRRD